MMLAMKIVPMYRTRARQAVTSGSICPLHIRNHAQVAMQDQVGDSSNQGASSRGRDRSLRAAEISWEAVGFGCVMMLVWPDGPGAAIALVGLVVGTIAHRIATRQ
jgi:hypothetical protein